MTKIAVENVSVPDQVTNVDATKYTVMKGAMLTVMSDTPMTAALIKNVARSQLSKDLFPGVATSGCWIKCVQLDLEAKGMLTKQATKPLGWSTI
ncbi:MAG: hypothetical protein ACI9ND_000262 [Yoonia sp.]|jgi:hypothetical protein